MIDKKNIWSQKFANLKVQNGSKWAEEFARTVDKRVTNKAELSEITGSVVFTFNYQVFAKMLRTLKSSSRKSQPATQIAAAWATAIQSSTITVAPGAYYQSATPATTWSVINSSLIDPGSITTAQKYLRKEILNANAVKVALKSPIPPAIRQAFLKLTVTIDGLDSTPSGSGGPLPLNVPNIPLL